MAKPDPFKKIFRRGLPLYYSTHILLLDFDQIHTYVQVWSIQQYMKSDRHAPAMQTLMRNHTIECMTFNELTQILVQIAPMVHI